MRATTLILIPTYNERENVEAMARQVLAQGLEADLLFVDDHSPDGTGETLRVLAAGDPRIRVIHRVGKLGVGSAHLEGIRWAYDHGYEILVTMDCDFTHSPSDLGRMLAASAVHDVVVGSRYLDEDSLPGWNPLRRFLTHCGHFLTRTLLGMKYDATGAYRVYRLARIRREVFDLVRSTGYAFFFESLYVLHLNGYSVAQIPIALPARTYGHSKMSFLEPYRSLRQLIALFLTNRLDPGHFLLPGPPVEVDPSLVDPQGWDPYWARKTRTSTLVYGIAATMYRRLFIRHRLERVIRATFSPGSSLLHAGCGSGQVDEILQDLMRLTAIDISVPALRLYRQNNPRAAAVRHASLLALPFPDRSFDGVYSLGVLEHFADDQIRRILDEVGRVLKPGGRLVLFWPHAHSTTVWVLGRAHWLLNDVLNKHVQLHPPEPSLLRSRAHAESLMARAGLALEWYRFGPEDGFSQAVMVAWKQGAREVGS